MGVRGLYQWQDQRVRSDVMAVCVKTSLLAILLGIIFAGCASAPVNPAPNSNLSNQPAVTSSSTSFAAEINRNIAAAAMLSSNASADYRLGPEDLVEITIFNIPEAMTLERG
jgi:hypothetical protein